MCRPRRCAWAGGGSTSLRQIAWTGRTLSPRGFTFLDLLVVLVVLVGLVGLLAAYVAKQQGEGCRIRCASNLRIIATHAFIYSNKDRRDGGRFPRTYYDPSAPLDRSLAGNGTGMTPFDPANPTGPVGANNTAAALYLLVRATDLSPSALVCDAGAVAEMPDGPELARRANWPAPYADFNSYSYNCPYPTAGAVSGGWKFDNSLGPDHPLAADINPGDAPFGGPTTVAPTANRKAMRPGNSPNHWFEGQQVVYCDIHIEWQTSPFCGLSRPGVPYRDNIFASAAGGVDATGKGGTVWAAPQDPADAVLLPTAQDSLGSEIAARRPDQETPPPRRSLTRVERLLLVPIGAGSALCGLLLFRLKRRRSGEAEGGPGPGAAGT